VILLVFLRVKYISRMYQKENAFLSMCLLGCNLKYYLREAVNNFMKTTVKNRAAQYFKIGKTAFLNHCNLNAQAKLLMCLKDCLRQKVVCKVERLKG